MLVFVTMTQMYLSRSKLDQTFTISSEGNIMLRKLMTAMFVLSIAVGLTLTGSTAANAKTQASSTTDTSSTTANVYMYAYKSYDTGEFVVNAFRFDHMETDTVHDYSYAVYVPCDPTECGTIVFTTGKKATATLSLVGDTTVLYGYSKYSGLDGTDWDGSSIPMFKAAKVKGEKRFIPELQYLDVSLYNPALPVPDYTSSCCK